MSELCIADSDSSATKQRAPLIPRSYQVNLFNQALQENTIAVMDTGSGKTLVAAMLVQRRMQQERPELTLASQIHLLIIDECHHARKSHPYNHIMTEFYHNPAMSKPSERPRVFGMTASPSSNAGTKNAVFSASDLEVILDSRVFSVDKEELQEHVEMPDERIVQYERHYVESTTYLASKMAELCASNMQLTEALKDTPQDAFEVSHHLGAWCVDQIWRHAIQNLALASRTNRTIGDLSGAKSVMQRWKPRPPKMTNRDVTPKVQTLVDILRDMHKMFNSEFCGIIFVERRDTAAGLTILLQELEEFRDVFRVQALVGHNRRRDVLLRMTMREQNKVIEQFRNNDFNLLVATSVAEEGLDIQACNVVIRFDPIATTTSYVQSRGRARRGGSKYIIMQDRSSASELTSFAKIKKNEREMREWCQKSDKYRYRSDLFHHKGMPSDLQDGYLIPSTQALLTPSSAIPLLYRYCASLSRDEYCRSQPVFDCSHSDWFNFVCHLKLPSLAPICHFESDVAPNKTAARRSAAFKACRALHIIGALDDHFEPFHEELKEEDEGANESCETEAVAENGSYPRNTPRLWNHVQTSSLNNAPGIPLFACTIAFTADTIRGRDQHQAMALLTTEPLPFESHVLNIYVKGELRSLQLSTLSSPLQLEADQVSRLRQFTLTLSTQIARKKFDCIGSPAFFIAPLTASSGSVLLPDICWSTVDKSQTLLSGPLSDDDLLDGDIELQQLVVTVDRERTESYFVHGIVEGLLIDDTIPEAIFKAEIKDWRSATKKCTSESDPTFKEYFTWRRYDMERGPGNKALLLGKGIKRLRNHLQPAALDGRDLEVEESIALTLLPVSACSRNTFRASVLQIPLLIPSILFHIESMLLSNDAKEALGLQGVVDLDLLQTALTTSATNRDQSYERLEILGDSFLKFSSALRLFVLNLNRNEGQLTMAQSRIVSNDALMRHSLRKELYRYVTNVPFNRKSWQPIGFIVDGIVCGEGEVREQKLSNKTLADFVEAIMGAAFLSGDGDSRQGGVEAALTAAKRLGVPFKEFETWRDFERVFKEKTLERDESFAGSGNTETSFDNNVFGDEHFQKGLARLEITLGYKFKQHALILEALTHASAIQFGGRSYERLEFLGDAIHDFQVTNYYYHRYPDAPPGVISQMKTTAVNNMILGAIAIEWELEKMLIYESDDLMDEINKTVEAIATLDRVDEYWVKLATMPKILGDIVESTLGAVFVDCGFEYAVVSRLFEDKIRPFLDKHLSVETMSIHPTKAILEYLQGQGCTQFRCGTRELEETERNSRRGKVDPVFVCDYKIHNTTIATARGYSLKELRKQVAVEALKRIRSEDGLLESLCDCPHAMKKRTRTTIEE
ncbi:Dicer-like protein 1 [Podila humilis]|nr:Dicer-like protein 1 [Podila humilis]